MNYITHGHSYYDQEQSVGRDCAFFYHQCVFLIMCIIISNFLRVLNHVNFTIQITCKEYATDILFSSHDTTSHTHPTHDGATPHTWWPHIWWYYTLYIMLHDGTTPYTLWYTWWYYTSHMIVIHHHVVIHLTHDGTTPTHGGTTHHTWLYWVVQLWQAAIRTAKGVKASKLTFNFLAMFDGFAMLHKTCATSQNQLESWNTLFSVPHEQIKLKSYPSTSKRKCNKLLTHLMLDNT